MTVVVDAGGLTALAVRRTFLRELRERGQWPPVVPAVVLVAALTGDHRRDHAVNRVLRACLIVPTAEPDARDGARLRTLTGRAGSISAVDAVVASAAVRLGESTVLTSDPGDLTALLSGSTPSVVVERV